MMTPSLALGRAGLASLVVLLGIGLPTLAQAGWLLNKTLRNVRVMGDTGMVMFVTVEPIENPGNCPGAEFYGINVADNPKMQLSLLLSARAMGSKVHIYVPDPPASACDATGRPRVTSVVVGDW